MKQVFCVAAGEYSDYRVLAVFEDEATAKAWATAIASDENDWRSDARVETLPFVPAGAVPHKEITYTNNVELWDNGKIENRGLRASEDYPIASFYGSPPSRPYVRYVRAPYHRDNGGRLEVRGNSAETEPPRNHRERGGESNMSATISEIEKQVIQERLAVCSPLMRQEDISLFILRVATAATDLRRLCEEARQLPIDFGLMRDAVNAMGYLERQIREEFVKTFGHDMIAKGGDDGHGQRMREDHQAARRHGD